MHVESNESYRNAAQLLDDFRTELQRRRDEHTTLWLALTGGTIETGAPVTTAEEQAGELLAGRMPGSRADTLREAQAREMELREQLAAMQPLERTLAERVELARTRARQAAIQTDPRTRELAKRWQTAYDAAQAARQLEEEIRADLLAGAFGTPDLPRPDWVNADLMH